MAQARKAQIIITANASVAEKVMQELEGAATRASNRMRLLAETGAQIKEKMRQLAAANGKNTEEYKKLGEQLKQNNKDIKAAEKEFQAFNSRLREHVKDSKRVEEVMKQLATTATRDLRRALQAAKRELEGMTARDPRRAQLISDLKKIQQQIDKNTGSVKKQQGAWGALQTTLKNLTAYVGVFAMFNKIKSLIGDIVTKNKELSDSMANIRKVSQWASADVEKLTENLAKIDTRNTITTLQNLAYQGAKLGIGQYGVEGLSGFVRAAEQVQTALGEDLGEDALPALAKLTEVMGLIPKFGVEQAMQKAGSAIYQLGATSTATGKNIVEFSKRLMGLANVSGISADQLLGLGSAADSMALMPEVAATAFNKLFNSIHGNTEGIAKSVGIAKEELEGLLYEGRTMEALVKVFEKMQQMSMKELEGRGVFKELGSDGARLTNVMITMANKVDMLKSHLDVANQSFSEGKAVINEYLIQQETAAAYFDRAANIWTKTFVNPEGVDVVKQIAQAWYNVSYEMTHSASTMASINLTLQMLSGTVMTLIKYLPTLVQLLMFYGVGATLQAIYLEFRAIYQAATLAGTAAAKFNAILKTNAIALAVTGVMMLVAKYYELAEAEKAVAAEEEHRKQIFNDAAAEAIQVYEKQKDALDKYNDALKKSNGTEEERNEIIKKFKGEFGTYLEKLGIEIKTYGDMENALRRVNNELKMKAFYETGQKLRENYVGDAKQAQTNALSQFMQVAQKYNIPTSLMEDIVEGKITSINDAMAVVNKDKTKLNNKWAWEIVREEDEERSNRNLYETVRDGIMDFFSGTPAERVTSQETRDVYHAVNNLVNASNEVNNRNKQVDKFIEQYADKYSPNISVEGAIANLKRLKELNEDKLNEGLNVLRDEWKKMSETERGTDRGKQIGGAIDQYGKQLRSMRGEGYNPPPSAKEIAKQQSEAKQQMRKDMKDAQEASTGILSKLEEYYRLQETAIQEARADGQLTEDQAKEMVRSLNIMKNESLATARRAVVTGDTKEWDKLKTTILPAVLSDTSEVSRTLLETIQKVAVDKLHNDLKKFNGGDKVFGLDSRAFFDQMRAKAAGNEREAARLRAKVQNEVEKALLQYQFVEKANQQMRKDVENMGITTETYEQFAKRMQAGIMEKQPTITTSGREITDEQAYREMGNKFVDMGVINFRYNIENEEEARQWIKKFATDVKGDLEGWAQAFPQLVEWIDLIKRKEQGETLGEREKKALEEAMPAIRNLFNEMMNHAGRLDKAMKDAFQHEKEQMESRFKIAGYTDKEKELDKLYANQAKQQETGAGQSFAQMLGLGSIAQDPEIQQIQNRIYWRQQEVEYARKRLDELKAMQDEELAKLRETAASKDEIDAMEKQHAQDRAGLEQLLADRQTALSEQMENLTTKTMQELQKRVKAVQGLTKPFADAAGNIGKKLGEMIRGAEEDSQTWNEIWKAMLLAVSESMLEMAGQFAQNLIVQQAMNRAGEADEAQHATVMTMFGISSGAAKTIGTLGWLGIALIPVITALLMGLLQGALSTSKSSKSTAATKKVKLASGMLTYDEGNVQTVVGNDGRVYRAREQRSLPSGVSMVTEPIATTVNGQQALVGERGPEIVIGRKTTRAIQMNRPDLLRDLALIDRGITTRKIRTFDEGNIQDLASAIRPVDAPTGSATEGESNSPEMRQTLDSLSQTVAALSATVLQLQKNGIPAKIQKYGKGGLIDEVQSGLKFESKYK